MSEDETQTGVSPVQRFAPGLYAAMNGAVDCIDDSGQWFDAFTPETCVRAAKKAGLIAIHLYDRRFEFVNSDAGDVVIVRPMNRVRRAIRQRQEKPWWYWYVVVQGTGDSTGITVCSGKPRFTGKVMLRTPWFEPKSWGITYPNGENPIVEFLHAFDFPTPEITRLPEEVVYLHDIDQYALVSEGRTLATQAINRLAKDAGLTVSIFDKPASSS